MLIFLFLDKQKTKIKSIFRFNLKNKKFFLKKIRIIPKYSRTFAPQNDIIVSKCRIGLWCKGSTTVFGSVCLGSNPGSPTINIRFSLENRIFLFFSLFFQFFLRKNTITIFLAQYLELQYWVLKQESADLSCTSWHFLVDVGSSFFLQYFSIKLN